MAKSAPRIPILILGLVVSVISSMPARLCSAANTEVRPCIRDGESILFVGSMVRPQAYYYAGCVATGLEAIGIHVEVHTPNKFRNAKPSAMRKALGGILQQLKPEWVFLAPVADKKKMVLDETAESCRRGA